MKIFTLFLVALAFFEVFGSEKIISYSGIDTTLQETWEKTYPVMYSRILKKDVLGKGIMELREKNRPVYLYTFIVYFPKYHIEIDKLVGDEDGGQEILVKLYFRPYDKESPYRVDMGEFWEKYNPGNVRWIK